MKITNLRNLFKIRRLKFKQYQNTSKNENLNEEHAEDLSEIQGTG
jgi:hypothetical protein